MTDQKARNTDSWRRWSQWALWFNAISAVWGGGYLVGGAKHMPATMLDGTPFDGFIIPGIILSIIVGGSSLLGAVAHIRAWPQAADLTLAAGAILLGWLLVEFILIPEGWAPQAIYTIAGVVMVIGGLRIRNAAGLGSHMVST